MTGNNRQRILILGGTKDAAELAAELVGKGHDVTTSLAGRTREPRPLLGKTRTGGFGGASGLATYLSEGKFDLLIDATHPFARQISENAIEAALQSGITIEIRTRTPWTKEPGDTWIEVSTLEEANNAIPANARVLLALGSQYLDRFFSRNDVYFLVRMVDPPVQAMDFVNFELLIARPSHNWQEERKMLENQHITHIVCRNSGGTGAYAKIEAARALGMPVIMIGR